MLRARLATAAVALPLIIWLIFAGPIWLFRGVVIGFCTLALVEFFSIAFPGQRRKQVFGIVGGSLVALAMGTFTPLTGASVVYFEVVLAMVGLGLIGALSRPEDPARALADLGSTLFGVLYAAAFLPHLIWIRVDGGVNGSAWVLFVIAVGMAGDTAGYFAGRSFGRRPLMPEVSPKKTVEGAMGAIGGNLLAGAILQIFFLVDVSLGAALAIAAVAGVLGQVGDLCESLVKRAFQAKDSGFLLPGHGGVLDRIDSLVFPSVFVYHVAMSLPAT